MLFICLLQTKPKTKNIHSLNTILSRHVFVLNERISRVMRLGRAGALGVCEPCSSGRAPSVATPASPRASTCARCTGRNVSSAGKACVACEAPPAAHKRWLPNKAKTACVPCGTTEVYDVGNGRCRTCEGATRPAADGLHCKCQRGLYNHTLADIVCFGQSKSFSALS